MIMTGPMPNRIFHTLDTCIAIITTTVTAISAWLLSAPATTGGVDELQLLLVPLIGSLIASGGMIMLNPCPETRKIVIGRAVFALLFGSATPHATALVFSWAEPMTSHPVLLLVAGAVSSMVFYAISKPFTAKLYARSETIANMAERKLERKLGVNHRKEREE